MTDDMIFATALEKADPAKRAAYLIEEVRKELKRRNPEFDETLTPTMQGDIVTGLECFSDRITDISPVRALPHLKALNCRGNGLQRGALSDLTPLKGMRLQTLTVSVTAVSDPSPLRGMPLTRIYLDFDPRRDGAMLRSLTTLQSINDQSASEFLKNAEQ